MKKAIRSIFAKKKSKGTDPESRDVPPQVHNSYDNDNINSRRPSCQGVAASSARVGSGVGSKNRETTIIRTQQHLKELDNREEMEEESMDGYGSGTSCGEVNG